MNVFERYAPFIQDYIYSHDWENLRGIQVAAGEAIFNTDDHVLLCAGTASGKTEAAFFPILTLMEEDPPSSVGVLYIAPLKALINDQFERLDELCEEAHIPVTKWHGDASTSKKRKLLKHPAGVLQITPESLEALVLKKHMEIPHLFGDLRFIVIDEIHSLLRGDRGGQTFCLLERLSRLAGVNPRRIGLSATIGQPELAAAFLAQNTDRKTQIPKIQGEKTRWRLSMEHFYKEGDQAAKGHEVEALPLEAPTDQAPRNANDAMAYIFEHTRGKKCLVFTNSREECEAVCQSLRLYCEYKHEPDRFLIHHGNLSTSYRESAEEAMKDEDTYMTTCATATLELGIDIGRLERAFQIDAPFTVSGFLQRMGRTGRRGSPSEMWFVMQEEYPETRAMLPEKVPWTLIQGIALVQLYIEERWVEPPRLDRMPFSLLFHQTMSELASSGPLTPRDLARRILTLAPFHNISQEDYKVLLRHLLETDMIEMDEHKQLMVGLAGERVVNSYKFYAVFQENVEYSVHADSKELGTIVKPPPIGEKIAIAGRVWVVDDVDHEHHHVYVHVVKGKIPAYFGDVPGDIHTRILLRMKQVLLEDTSYRYLRPNAVVRLKQARETARNGELLAQSLIPLGKKMYCLFPWLGTYAFLALERFLKLKCGERLHLRKLSSSRPYFITFTMDVSMKEFYQILYEEACKEFDPLDLVYEKEVPIFDKYDRYLPDELVKKGFAYGVLDVKQMIQYVKEVLYLEKDQVEDDYPQDLYKAVN